MKNNETSAKKSAKKSNKIESLNNLRAIMKSQIGSPIFAIKQLYIISEAEVCTELRKVLPKVGRNKAASEHADALSKFAGVGTQKTIKRKLNGVETIITYTVKNVSVDCALRYFRNLYLESAK